MPPKPSRSKPRLDAGRRSRGLTAALLAFLLWFGLRSIGVVALVEHWTQDQLRRLLARPLHPSIELVYLDDVSLHEAEKQFGLKYPWPREVHAAAVDVLRRAEAKVIVFDFLFSSASSYGDDDDRIFAAALRQAGNVVLGMQFTAADQPTNRAGFFKLKPLHRLGPAVPTLERAGGVDHPKEPLWSAAAGVGDTSFIQDEDSRGRRARLAVALDGVAFPSLALAAARVAGVETAWHEPNVRNILFRRLPTRAPVRYFDLAASKARLDEGLSPLVDLARFKDKVVVIGSSAPGLLDLRPSPLGKALPGALQQAMILDNLLTGEFLRPVLAQRRVQSLVVALLIVLAAVFSFRLRALGLALPPLLLGAILGGGALAYAHGLLLPIGSFSLAVVLGLGLGAVEHFVREQRERRRIQNRFGQFLSPAVLASLKEKGDQLELGGETRILTVFFSDLQGFTQFSEKLQPHDLVRILNEYLNEMGEVIVGGHDATVDKYIGDAIMAFWNAPLDQPDHAWRGCAAAWHCQVRLAQIQDRLKSMGLDAGDEGLVMRIGLNTGPAVAGLMGSRRKLNYTVMGDTVNTASRLEGANKPYGSRILISQATKDAAGPRVLTRPLDYLRVKGKAEATAVYEVIGLEGEANRLYDAAYVQRWSAALAAYKAGDFSAAQNAFAACAAERPQDKACALFIERCARYRAEPPQNWDGVYTMKTK